MSLSEFLRFLNTSAGINAAIGFCWSFAVEWIPAYTELPRRAKRVIMLGLCLLIPTLATVGLIAMGEAVLDESTIWAALLAGFAAFMGSQAAQLRQL